MRVLHIINSLGPGGAENLLIDSLPLLENHPEVSSVDLLALTDREHQSDQLARLAENGIKLHVLSHLKTLYHPSYLTKLAAFLKKNRFDAIHVHLAQAQIYISILASLGALQQVKIVTTEHGIVEFRRTKKIYKIIDRLIFKSFDAIICISDDMRTKFQTWLPETKPKLFTVTNGVNIERVSKATALPSLRKELSVPDDAFLVCVPARFRYDKDHETIIRALPLLPSDAVIIFCGNGPLMEEKRQKIREMGYDTNVRFLGFRNDVLNVMKTSDLVLLSSFAEGVSGVTLEALALRKPFLGSDVVGINTIIDWSKCLFKAGDEQALATRIVEWKINSDLRAAYEAKALQIVAPYSLDSMVDSWVKIYKSA